MAIWILGTVALIVLIVAALCKTASITDEQDEKWYAEHLKEMNNETDSDL